PSARRRRLAGHALSLRHEDRGFSHLPDLRRRADRDLPHRGRPLRRGQREHLRRRGSLPARGDAPRFRGRDDGRPAGAPRAQLDAGSIGPGLGRELRVLSPRSRVAHEGETEMPAEKVAIVTAGGSGMGAAAARRLAADGFRVAILSSSGKGEALAKELGGLGVTGSNQSTDDLKRLVDGTMARWGRIDVLVNSAGHGPRASVLELTDQPGHTRVGIFLMNGIRPTRPGSPIMANQKAGVIINVSTAWAFEPSPMFPTSAVFRAGLAAFTKLFADEYAAQNVRMNNVLPGWIDSLPATEERRQSVPMRRYG